MKFLKTIRFDPSDTHVFEHAAEPDEWAIPGGFWFNGIHQPEDIKGKLKQAFSNGFLSLESFGFSTFSTVSEIFKSDLDRIEENLTVKLLSEFGAPSREAAKMAAQQEIQDTLNLCADVQINSVFAIKRIMDENSEIRESYSLVNLPEQNVHTKVWEIIE